MPTEEQKNKAMELAMEHAKEEIWMEPSRDFENPWQDGEIEADIELVFEFDGIEVRRSFVGTKAYNVNDFDIDDFESYEDEALMEDMKEEFCQLWAEEHWESFLSEASPSVLALEEAYNTIDEAYISILGAKQELYRRANELSGALDSFAPSDCPDNVRVYILDAVKEAKEAVKSVYFVADSLNLIRDHLSNLSMGIKATKESAEKDANEEEAEYVQNL